MRAGKLRWTGAVILLVLASLLVAASIAARFARSELLDTDRYVATVAPLASDPDVQAAITTRVSAEIMQAADIPELTRQFAEALGLRRAEQAATLAAPAIASWVDGQVTKIVDRLVTSPAFVTLWTEANRSAHTQINRLLTGADGTIVSTQQANIVIDLGAVLAAAKSALIEQGWTFLDRLPDRSIPYTVATLDRLPEIQRAVSLLDKAATWLPILAAALLALGVWCAPNRRRALLLGLLISVAALIAILILYGVARDRYADRVAQNELNVPAALSIWDTALRYLVTAFQTVAVTLLLGAVWTYLGGPGRPATAFRRAINSGLDRAGRLIGSRPSLSGFVSRWHTWIALVLAVLAVWWLLASPTIGTAVTVTLVAALLTAGLTTLRRLPA